LPRSAHTVVHAVSERPQVATIQTSEGTFMRRTRFAIAIPIVLIASLTPMANTVATPAPTNVVVTNTPLLVAAPTTNLIFQGVLPSGEGPAVDVSQCRAIRVYVGTQSASADVFIAVSVSGIRAALDLISATDSQSFSNSYDVPGQTIHLNSNLAGVPALIYCSSI